VAGSEACVTVPEFFDGNRFSPVDILVVVGSEDEIINV
jgi:hypothetical protein